MEAVSTTTKELEQTEPENGTFSHPGTWTGCGGNIDGHVSSGGSGNCGESCSNCGKSTHWSCCGDTNKNSTKCKDHIQHKQALKNMSIFYFGTNQNRVAVCELEGIDFFDNNSSGYVLK